MAEVPVAGGFGTTDGPERLQMALKRMTRRFPQTALWNDSVDPAQLDASISFGAVGATCNPVIALAALQADTARWTDRLRALAVERPSASESELGWVVIKELSVEAARLLMPVFDAHAGRNGRLSMQTDPRLYRSASALVEQAVHFDSLAPNIIVKIPATSTGIVAIEEATYRGVSINATVSFSVAQAVAVAEAIERGMDRREAEGMSTDSMGPVATIMGGRLDDWIRAVVHEQGLLLEPGTIDWAGVAALKRAYEIFARRGYRTRVLSAAFRSHLHLSELVGGDLVVSPPFAWQQRINDADLALDARIDVSVDEKVIDELRRKVPDFARAYEPGGLSVKEFDSFGATRRTLREFLAAVAQMDAFVRDVLLPAPARSA